MINYFTYNENSRRTTNSFIDVINIKSERFSVSCSPNVGDLVGNAMPEIMRSAVFKLNATFTTLTRVKTSSSISGFLVNNYNSIIVARDIPSNSGIEINAGGTVYSINLTSGVLTPLNALSTINSEISVNQNIAIADADINIDGLMEIDTVDYLTQKVYVGIHVLGQFYLIYSITPTDSGFQFVSKLETSDYTKVLYAPGNTFSTPFYLYKSYNNSDVNMDGYVVFQGTGNDVNYIYQNVLTNHSGNNLKVNYFIIKEQLP